MDFSASTLSAVFDHVPMVLYRCQQKGIERQFHFVTSYIHTLTGLTSEEFFSDSKAFFRRIHPEDRNSFLRCYDHHPLFPATLTLEYRILGPGEKITWVQEQSVILPVGAGNPEIVYQGVLVEIPDHQQVKEELRRWDHELQSLTGNLPDIIARIDRKCRIMYLNKWWDTLEPPAPERYLGKHFENLGLSPRVAQIFDEKIHTVLEHGETETIEISHPTIHGMKTFEIRFCPEPALDAKILTVLMVCRDMTDVREAESAFRDSDEKFRQLAETVDSVFWMWDVELQQIIYVSPAYERQWGGNPSRLMDNLFDWLTIVAEEDRVKVEELFLKRIDSQSLDFEYRILTHRNELRWVHNRTFPIKDAHGQICRVIGIAQDVTEQKKWEEERLRAAKLESLGLLAGGLAHDFNNLLTAILGQLSLAKYTLDASHPLFNRITEAEQASLRAQDIARQLLTFSKGGTPVTKIVSLQAILEENVRLVLAGSSVRPVFFIAENLWPVKVDVGQICQVIHNLVINARQSMEHGGECIIQARNVLREELVTLSPDLSPTSHWVQIAVIDQGTGIIKENLEKIFDPYFTTKLTGSGLGLATSYSIVKHHGGSLSVESEPGKGSRFSLMLPAHASVPVLSESVEQQIKFGQGRILVMDDELQIRKVLGEMLETCGYGYQTAKDGDEALTMFCRARALGQPFSAVILDLTVPGGVGGKEILTRLLKIDPQVKAIVISGYSNDPVLANYQEYGFKGRVEKPFNLANLSDVLHSVLQNTYI